MDLNVELREDSRGRRSIHARLHLTELPEDAGLWRSWRLIDHDVRLHSGGNRLLARLNVAALDTLDIEIVSTALEERNEELSRRPGAQIEHHGVKMSFLLRDERVESERDAILKELIHVASVRLRQRSQWTPLRVLRIELSEFRGMDRLTLAFSENQTTVLVGANGSGKTTVLDAIALLLSRMEAGLRKSSQRERALTEDDIMNSRDASRVTITAAVGGDPVTWTLARARGGDPSPPEEGEGLFKLAEAIDLLQRAVEGGDVSLPLAVYYPVNRAVLDIPLRIGKPHLFDPLEAYDGALTEGRSNFRLFFEWFRSREDLENEIRTDEPEHRDHQLEAVRRAIVALAPGFSDLRVKRSPLRMEVTKGDWKLYVDQLSDGEKCLLAMTGDLARRLAMANPLADDPLRGGGVVLIDEIELHLHPGWQRRIVPALERTFPRCQFIISTHSPAVLGHVDRDSIFILKPEKDRIDVKRPDASMGLDVNRILEDLLDVPERPAEFKEKLDRLHDLIDQGETIRARELHGELSATLGASEPSLVKAEVLLRRKEAGRR